MINNTITAPKGFLAAGLHCGVKKSGKYDLGMIVCPGGANAAAVFTTNKIQSAAVQIAKKHVKNKKIYAVIVNSGNANACTGALGIKNAVKMCEQTALHIGEDPHTVLVASTGIIGEQLPIKTITDGIANVAGKLSAEKESGQNFTSAIMTTDTKPKMAARQIDISGVKVTIAGTVKGAGMIAPNMATTLCFITTDIAITKPLLNKALKNAIGNSLNKLTVDGHQSTNDTAILLASGSAGNRPVTSQCPRFKKFTNALNDLCDDLARQMAHDAEGATRIFKVVVNGAASQSDAAKACRAIADYPLVKCAIHGSDPNWGRIICAVGSSGVKLNTEKLSCKIGSVTVFHNGKPRKFDAQKVSKIVSQPEHTILVDLGAGKKNDFCYGCDLSAEYVSINADYHT
ncbi:MAG: bifunctional glutamate N-acetyltransferase/amino-acid acetyltransferase ArgJ [Sedimentisphaerales bacterium]|nr:bifunctional glutamate N-acetyltransferase/amino-acid acetyltransferase ArgJ [Sedimentisphaerales bacterium]